MDNFDLKTYLTEGKINEKFVIEFFSNGYQIVSLTLLVLKVVEDFYLYNFDVPSYDVNSNEYDSVYDFIQNLYL